MKKKFNKDFINHWLYPYIGSYAMNFEGMSFGRLYQLLCTLLSNLDTNSNIRLTDLIPIPLGNHTFSITCSIYYYSQLEVHKFQTVTTYPINKYNLSRYGTLKIDDKGFYRFEPNKKWIIK